MPTLFDALSKKIELSSTFDLGLLQTKAYKAIMGTTSDFLCKSDISNTEWVAMGVISEQAQGIRATQLSSFMDVEQPFITVIVAKLTKRGYLKVSVDPTDKRAKIIFLSKEGKSFVKQMEAKLSKEIQSMSEGITVDDALGYIKVLNTIVDYYDKKHKK